MEILLVDARLVVCLCLLNAAKRGVDDARVLEKLRTCNDL